MSTLFMRLYIQKRKKEKVYIRPHMVVSGPGSKIISVH
jgi:hypothetical protein